MIKEFGERIRPMLKQAFDQVRNAYQASRFSDTTGAVNVTGMNRPKGGYSERADIPLNERARRAAFVSADGRVVSTGKRTHFETNEDLGPDFLAIGAGSISEDGFFRFGSDTMDNPMGETPSQSQAAAARHNREVYDSGRRPSELLEDPPGLERVMARGQAMPDTGDTPQPRRYVSMEKFIEEAGDELGEVLPNAYRSIEFNDDNYPTHLVSFSDTRNSMYRSRVPSKEFFDWLATVNTLNVKLFGIKDGRLVFPREPLLRLEGPLAVL
jgi:hypothetical protein